MTRIISAYNAVIDTIDECGIWDTIAGKGLSSEDADKFNIIAKQSDYIIGDFTYNTIITANDLFAMYDKFKAKQKYNIISFLSYNKYSAEWLEIDTIEINDYTVTWLWFKLGQDDFAREIKAITNFINSWKMNKVLDR